jgi:hypothetical protein
MKLEKREIIILVVAALFILWGGYTYFIAPSGKKVKTAAPATTAAPVKAESFAGEINAELTKNKISDFDKYVIKRAGMNSRKDPFLKKDLYRAWIEKDNKGNSAIAKMIYSGYVDSRKSIIAIINGVEYRAGEKLVEEGYILKQITPSKVLIFDKRSGSNLEIPIQE